MTQPRALLTGASGFIGSHLTRHLVNDGYEVHVMARPSSDLGRIGDVRESVVAHAADVRDAETVRAVVEASCPDHVFHLAAATMHGGRAPGRDEQVATTLGGSIAMMDACARVGVNSFVHVGNAFEYGPNPDPVTEAAHCRPTTLDGITTLGATLYGGALARSGALATVTVRPFSVIGPADDPRRLVPRLLDAAATGETVPMSDPMIVRDFVWVDDIVALCLLAAARADELTGLVLNGGSGTATTLGELAAAVETTTGRAVHADWGAYRVADHDRALPVADTTLTRALGWSARTGLAMMLERCWAARGDRQASPGAAEPS